MVMYFTQAVVAGMMGGAGFTTAIDAGTAAVIEIYSGAVPANADATPVSPVLLASLTCSATAISGITDTGTAARATFAAISPDASADATGTASYFRIKTQTGGTVVLQGAVGVTGSGAELILNSTAITAGSQVSITSVTIDLLE